MSGDVATADVLTVARAYAGRDDWGVENISLRTLGRLLDQLAAGLDADDIAAHASHVRPDNCPIERARLALVEP